MANHKRVVKRAVHEFVADLIIWDVQNNQSDALQELIDQYGYANVNECLAELEGYHSRFAGKSSVLQSTTQPQVEGEN